MVFSLTDAGSQFQTVSHPEPSLSFLLFHEHEVQQSIGLQLERKLNEFPDSIFDFDENLWFVVEARKLIPG